VLPAAPSPPDTVTLRSSVRQRGGSAIPEGEPELAVSVGMVGDALESAAPEEADPDEASPVGLAVASAESVDVLLFVEPQPVDATATSANPASSLLPDEKFTWGVCNRDTAKDRVGCRVLGKGSGPHLHGREGAT
jgi:hypothetical protein